MANLNVNIAGIAFRNPVLTASGTFGYGPEFADFVDFSRLGGIIVKGTTLHPREGNPYPRMAETPAGMLNCVGLQNKGVDHYAASTRTSSSTWPVPRPRTTPSVPRGWNRWNASRVSN